MDLSEKLKTSLNENIYKHVENLLNVLVKKFFRSFNVTIASMRGSMRISDRLPFETRHMSTSEESVPKPEIVEPTRNKPHFGKAF